MHSISPALPSGAMLLSFFSHVQCQGESEQPYRNWTRAYESAEKLVSSWSTEQQANVSVRYVTAPGFVPFEPSDGPTGVANGQGVSGWGLVSEHYSRMAVEFREKGYTMLLGPSTGPLGRSSLGSRLWEGLGTDPYLNGKLDDPTDRTSSNLDDRTLHELYLWPWIDGIASGMGSLMCVMNRVNGIIGCENDRLLNGILKNETGLKGFVLPDVTAPLNETTGLLGSLDWNSGYNISALMAEVEKGNIPKDVITDHALRIAATQLKFLHPQSEYASPDETSDLNVRDPSSKDINRRSGAESIVLLKNKNNTLPLSNVTPLGIFGKDAANLNTGPSVKSHFSNFQGDTRDGHLVTGGGSASPGRCVVSPLDALTLKAAEGKGFNYKFILSDNWTVAPPESTGEGFFEASGVSVFEYASASEHCLVCLNAYGKEGADRRTLADEEGDQLVNDAAEYCASTIADLNNAGVRLVDAWIGNENVTAVLNAGALGQESGNAVVDDLFGAVNPSGKLVYIIAKSADDYNGHICECCECDYTESLYIDYRHFDQAEIEPRFEFGFGLSYASFIYSNLIIEKTVDIHSLPPYPTGFLIPGGPPDIFDELLTFTADVTNTVYLEPGETKTVAFLIHRRGLSIWDEDEQGWKAESGEFKAYLGRSSRVFTLEVTFEAGTA
ncbi:glycoside hydrolase family 3 C-terminal domain-containing protein [Aspergillus unguis]